MMAGQVLHGLLTWLGLLLAVLGLLAVLFGPVILAMVKLARRHW